MAKYRPPEFCANCGKQLKAVYKNQSGVPFMQKIIGDTFLRYEPCGCNKVKKAKPEEIKTIDIILENRQLKYGIAEGRKEIERLKGVIESYKKIVKRLDNSFDL